MIICLILMTIILNGVSLEYLDCDQAKSEPNTNGMAGIFAMITSMIFVGFLHWDLVLYPGLLQENSIHNLIDLQLALLEHVQIGVQTY